MQKLEIHPLANLLPEMTPEEFKGLKDDILGLGVLNPIILLDGKILDGRHRYLACQELDIDCPTMVMSDASPNDIITSMNIHRRHLTVSQRALFRAGLLDYIREQASARKKASLKQNQEKDTPESQENTVLVNLPKREEPIHTHEILAKDAQVSPKTMQHAITVHEHGTEEEKKEVADGKKPIYKVAKGIKERQKVEEAETTKTKAMFNKTTESIEWAAWTWNPITGCERDCPYCYAKAMATRYASTFNDFKPTFHPDRLKAPKNMKVPKTATDSNLNVFTGSMCDTFAEWNQDEWVIKTLQAASVAPWNYLFLTKSPERINQFKQYWTPERVWIGATVDTQARVDKTMEAFSQLNRDKKTRPAVTFISCEPMLEPIKFPNGLQGVDWLIIGGRSAAGGQTEFQPEWSWVESLVNQAREANCLVYFKPNLKVRPKEFPILN